MTNTNTLMTHVTNAIKLLEEKSDQEPHYLPILKNLQDALRVYHNSLTNLDTVLEDSINKLRAGVVETSPLARKWPWNWN
jgi:hypothetical protein